MHSNELERCPPKAAGLVGVLVAEGFTPPPRGLPGSILKAVTLT